MLNIGYTLSCTQQTFNIDIHSNELIREGFMKIIRNKEEVYEIACVNSNKLDILFYNMMNDKRYIVTNAHNNDIYMVKYYYFPALNHHLL